MQHRREMGGRRRGSDNPLCEFHNGFPGRSVVEDLPANAVDEGSISGLGRAPGDGNGNPLQYSCLGNPMDRGAWRATVHRVAKSWTPLKWLSMQMSFTTSNPEERWLNCCVCLISLVLLASLISSYQCDFTDSRLGERRVSHAGSSTAGLYQGETWE